MKCVVSRIVLPRASSCFSRSQITCRACGSSPVVGSSMKIRSGSLTSARASVRRRFMPPESSPMRASFLCARFANSSSPGTRASTSASAQPEVAAVHDEVLGHGEVRIEVVHLRHDADADARATGVARHRLADQRDLAAIRLGEAEAAAQRRRLAGAVRAEQRVAGAASNRERQAVDDGRAAVVLAQPVDDEHVIGNRGGRRRQGAHPGDQSKRPAEAAGLCSLAGAGAQLASSAAGAASGCGRSTSSTNAIGALSPTRKPIFRMRV